MVVKLSIFKSSVHFLTKGSFKLLSSRGSPHYRKYCCTMAGNADVGRLKTHAQKAESMIANLEEQIKNIRKAAVKQAGLGDEEKLRKENEKLKQEVQSLNTALVVAEIMNGVRQVHVPSKNAAVATVAASLETSAQSAVPLENGPSSSVADAKEQKGANSQKAKQSEDSAAGAKKSKKEAKPKKEDGDAKKAAGGADGAAEVTIDVSRLDMRVGKIVSVEKHPKADKLYVEQVDLGEGKIRTICSGLVDHIPLSAMRDRVAVFMINLKPVKMREIFSQGMIMCANSSEKTEILVPPPDAEIGDRVIFEDYPGVPDQQLNPKKKIWETIKPDVRTDKDRVATYKGCPFTIKGKGVVVAPTLADAQIS